MGELFALLLLLLLLLLYDDDMIGCGGRAAGNFKIEPNRLVTE
jgi:hypothetical protein